MTLIIDASVALKWFMEEPGIDPGRRDSRPPRRWINCFRIIVPTA